MIRPTRGVSARVLCLCMCFVALSTATALAAQSPSSFPKESVQAYEQQLSSGQIQAVKFNRRLRSMYLTLKDGGNARVVYPPRGSPKLIAALEAKHVQVTIESKAEADKEAKARPVHHKLRYIVAGAVILVLALVGGALMLVRKRRLAAEE